MAKIGPRQNTPVNENRCPGSGRGGARLLKENEEGACGHCGELFTVDEKGNVPNHDLPLK